MKIKILLLCFFLLGCKNYIEPDSDTGWLLMAYPEYQHIYEEMVSDGQFTREEYQKLHSLPEKDLK